MSQASLVASIHSSAPKRNAFPKRQYNQFLKPTFASREHEDRWFNLSKSDDWIKPMVSCLCPHGQTLHHLEIRTQVYALFERTFLDLNKIMGLPAYHGLVYEFLASFVVTHGETQYGEDSGWEFRIQNTNFKWSRQQALFFLDFPDYGVLTTPTKDQYTAFWNKHTGLKEFAFDASPYSLQSLAWQYVHRLIATNINCQPETVDYVSLEDLELMWALGEGEPIDWYRVFSMRFLSMQQQFGPRRFVGCTSLITLIAKYCGFQFLCAPYEYRVLDFACLRKLQLIARIPGPPATLTDVSEDETETDPEEPDDAVKDTTLEEPIEKKRRVEIGKGEELNTKVDWNKVRRVVVYEF